MRIININKQNRQPGIRPAIHTDCNVIFNKIKKLDKGLKLFTIIS